MREQLGGKIESMADKLDALSRGLNHKVISTHADRRTDTSNAGGGGGMGRRKFSLSKRGVTTKDGPVLPGTSAAVLRPTELHQLEA